MRLLALPALLLLATGAAAQASWTTATGRVTDLETGEPVEGATVQFLRCDALDAPASCRPIPARLIGTEDWMWLGPETDADGRFEQSAVVPGVYAFRVLHSDYHPAQTVPYQDRGSAHAPDFEVALFPLGWASPAPRSPVE